MNRLIVQIYWGPVSEEGHVQWLITKEILYHIINMAPNQASSFIKKYGTPYSGMIEDSDLCFALIDDDSQYNEASLGLLRYYMTGLLSKIEETPCVIIKQPAHIPTSYKDHVLIDNITHSTGKIIDRIEFIGPPWVRIRLDDNPWFKVSDPIWVPESCVIIKSS